MDSLIAYCGIDCATCPIHLATLEQDPLRQRSMRLEIAELCARQYSLDVPLEAVTDCDGCSSPAGRLFSGCAKCEIRACTVQRQLTSCAFCADYACANLLKRFETDPEARARLEAIRKAV